MVRNRSSYFQTVFLLFFAATTFPILLLSVVTTGLSTSLVDSIISSNVSDSLEVTGLKLADFNERTGRGLVAVAANLQILAMVERGLSLSGTEREKADAIVRARFRADEPPTNVHLISLKNELCYSSAALPGVFSADSPTIKQLIERISARPAGITYFAQKNSSAPDSYISYSIGTAIIGPSGKPAGYIIADIPRETLRTILAPLPKIPELILLDENSYIAFSLSSPELEGTSYKPGEGGIDTTLLEYSSGRMKLVARKPSALVANLVERISFVTGITFCICVVLAFGMSFLLSRKISAPIMKLIEATKAVADGDLSVTLIPEQSGDIALLMKNFNVMVSDLQTLFAKTVEEQELLKRAELDSLRAQINPHFFFNALSSISALSKLGACREITTVTTALGKLLRSSISNKAYISTISESLSETRNYLVIEKIRFADRFSWNEEIDEKLLDCTIPRLAIQSLVENALIHGIEPNPEHSSLTIRVREKEGCVYIEIEDTGVGMSQTKMKSINHSMREGTISDTEQHIGLANTNRRIKLEYGPAYGIELRARDGEGLIASMSIPCVRSPECTA